MKSLFKRLNTSGHFPDFKHTAKGQRDNKKIRSRKERRKMSIDKAIKEIEEYIEDADKAISENEDYIRGWKSGLLAELEVVYKITPAECFTKNEWEDLKDAELG